MKRVFVALACIALASPLFAAKPRPVSLATATNTINGTPLTIVIGDDTSMQVFNSNVPGTGQFYPPDTVAGETANAGVWIKTGGFVYGPVLSTVAYVPVSMSAVTGTGTAGDPFTVVIVVNAGPQLQLTETLTYVNGNAAFNVSLSVSQIQPPSVPEGGIPFSAFIGADLYLADNDSGYPFAVPGAAAGGHAANNNCSQQLQYTISFLGTTPADAFTADGYSQTFSQIAAGQLTNNVAGGCLDDGAALQWDASYFGQPVTISTGVSFTGQAVPVGATVPALSPQAMAALVLLLAAVGYVLARKASPGA